MRKMLAAAAATIALGLGQAAFAETRLSGDVTASYSYGEFEAEEGEGEFETDQLGVAGRLAVPLSPSLALQLDAGYDYVDADGGDEADVLTGAVHFFYRQSDDAAESGYLIGGFLGAIDGEDDTLYGAGVEGEYYWPSYTLGGRFTYATNDDDDVDVDTYALEGYGKYFFNDNLSLRWNVGWANLEAELGGESEELDVIEAGARGEWQLASLPLSFIAGASYADLDDLGDGYTLSVGARWNFGPGTLKERNRLGADLEPFNVLGVGATALGSIGSTEEALPAPPEALL